jgi:prepilin-type N-terminal cleavage/methylation domain-containing protein
MKKKSKGFTLIEVLVSLAIVGLVLAALLKMEVSSISLATRTSLSFRALVIGMNEFDELEKTKFSGDFEKNVDPYTIKAKSEITTKSGLPLEIITLDVSYEDIRYAELKSFTLKAF